MAESSAERSRRYRLHKRGDHVLCRPGVCEAVDAQHARRAEAARDARDASRDAPVTAEPGPFRRQAEALAAEIIADGNGACGCGMVAAVLLEYATALEQNGWPTVGGRVIAEVTTALTFVQNCDHDMPLAGFRGQRAAGRAGAILAMLPGGAGGG